MQATAPQLNGRETTLALIERIAGGDMGGRLRSEVARWQPGATRDQIEEAFQEACLLASRACRGQSEGEVFVWLRTTTYREVGHMCRRARREVLVDSGYLPEGLAATPQPSAEEEFIDREDREEVLRLTHCVLGRLTDTQRKVAALHSHGRRRKEIAEHLGISPRTVKRALERILATGRAELVHLAGHGCDSGEDLVARFAFGLTSPCETRQAQLHIAGCPTCGGLYGRLDVWRENVAATVPVPAIEQAHPGTVEQALHGASQGLSRLREHVADGLGHVKTHAATTYSRVVDPTPLAGARPGAAAMALTGCLAIGGGATYCVQQATTPIGALGGVTNSAPDEPTPDKPEKDQPAQQAPASVAPTPAQPAPTPTTSTEPPAQASKPVEKPPPPPPEPEEEFEPVAPEPQSATSAQQEPQAPPSTPSEPAPAPASGPGEFDGP